MANVESEADGVAAGEDARDPEGEGMGARETDIGPEAESALFRASFDAAPIAMAITDPEGRYIRINRAMSVLLSQKEEELLGQPFQLRVHPEDLADELAQLDRLVRLEVSSYEAEHRRVHPDRGVIWVRERASLALDDRGAPIFTDERGRPKYIIRQLVDVTTEREWKTAIEEAHEEAIRANQAKSDFLSRMSHELRTPLNVVLGFAQLLELDGLSESQHEAVGYILKASSHLLTLINEVLDISRIESGNLSLSIESVPLAQALEEARELIRPLAEASGIALVQAPSPGPALVLADLSRLKQVLLNLLDNAIKYNRPGGSVTVCSTVIRDGWGRISVTDTGPGIGSDDLPRLFLPFERLGAEQSEIEGTGVGLALSHRLVEAMGGVLGIDTSVGQGSTFWVDLPLAQDPVAVHQASAGHPPPATADEARVQTRLLYIEDNLANFRLMERLFQHAELIPAMQGELGLALARQHRPDVVLLDLNLPDISGEEVLRRLRADAATAPIPVVVISADATPGAARRMLAAGARAYLPKPFDLRELRRLLREILEESPGGTVHGTR